MFPFAKDGLKTELVTTRCLYICVKCLPGVAVAAKKKKKKDIVVGGVVGIIETCSG